MEKVKRVRFSLKSQFEKKSKMWYLNRAMNRGVSFSEIYYGLKDRELTPNRLYFCSDDTRDYCWM